MDTWMWIAIAVAVVVVLLVAWASFSRARRQKLHRRFASEYDRTVNRAASRRRGERDLRGCEAEHEELDIQPLERAAATSGSLDCVGDGFRRPTAGRSGQRRRSAHRGDARSGYPVDDFDAKSRAVSVDHPDMVERYRRGHLIYLKTVEGKASTEDLRQAVIWYRALFNDLVREDSNV